MCMQFINNYWNPSPFLSRHASARHLQVALWSVVHTARDRELHTSGGQRVQGANQCLNDGLSTKYTITTECRCSLICLFTNAMTVLTFLRIVIFIHWMFCWFLFSTSNFYFTGLLSCDALVQQSSMHKFFWLVKFWFWSTLSIKKLDWWKFINFLLNTELSDNNVLLHYQCL